MGQVIARAVETNGNPVKSPTWTGWLSKSGIYNKMWQRRYFCLEEERLYYFKSPTSRCRGYISLKDSSGICILHHRPETEDFHREHIPFVICTSDRLWMMAFKTVESKNSFIEALQQSTDVKLARVIAEDWALLRVDRRKSRSKRVFLVYISNGELLYFDNGATTICSGRLAMNKLIQVDYKPQNDHPDILFRELSLILILSFASVTLTFDSQAQYDRWKFLLLNVLAGDTEGKDFLRYEKYIEEKKRKGVVKKAKRYKHSRKKRENDTCNRNQSNAEADVCDRNVNRSQGHKVDFSHLRNKKSKKTRKPFSKKSSKAAGDNLRQSEGIAMIEFKSYPPLPTDAYPVESKNDKEIGAIMSENIKKDYVFLSSKMPSRNSHLLQQQVAACTQAIGNLFQLYSEPLSPTTRKYMLSGDWYTKEPAGGKHVRHWIHRSERNVKDTSKNLEAIMSS